MTRGRRFGKRSATVAALAGLSCLAVAVPANAATTIGATDPSTNTCTAPTLVQTTSIGSGYTAQSAGVITSWSYLPGASPPATMKLRVIRPTGAANSFKTIGLSSPGNGFTDGQLATFPTRIAVQPGDVIGYSVTISSPYTCGNAGASATGFVPSQNTGSPALGSTDTYSPFSIPLKLDISAQLEADADGDGFGDETQDGCPDLATQQTACPLDVSIDKAPRSKTKKKRVTIEFSSSFPGASFECALDGSAFKGCTSPYIKNVGKGKHAFQVRAVSSSGRKGDPAQVRWKRKKH